MWGGFQRAKWPDHRARRRVTRMAPRIFRAPAESYRIGHSDLETPVQAGTCQRGAAKVVWGPPTSAAPSSLSRDIGGAPGCAGRSARAFRMGGVALSGPLRCRRAVAPACPPCRGGGVPRRSSPTAAASDCSLSWTQRVGTRPPWRTGNTCSNGVRRPCRTSRTRSSTIWRRRSVSPTSSAVAAWPRRSRTRRRTRRGRSQARTAPEGWDPGVHRRAAPEGRRDEGGRSASPSRPRLLLANTHTKRTGAIDRFEASCLWTGETACTNGTCPQYLLDRAA